MKNFNKLDTSFLNLTLAEKNNDKENDDNENEEKENDVNTDKENKINGNGQT